MKVHAPGRVNLMGDHTDYNDGFVLPMAIDRACTVTATRAGGTVIRARSRQFDGVVEVPVGGVPDPQSFEPTWGRFLAGVVSVLQDRALAVEPAALEISSTVPGGSGLSSSSALTVALTLALVRGRITDRRDLARLALDAEVRASGVPGGLMDQLASLFGVRDHALLIDCRSLEIEPIPLPSSYVVLVIHSGLPRRLADSAYAERRAACEATAARLGLASLRDATLEQVRDEPHARHVVTENQRVLDFATALRAADVNELGPLMLASHASLRDDYDVSTPELNLLVELLMQHAAIGARLTGAGFGGCVVALVQRNHADDVAAKTTRAYDEATGLQANAFVCRAVDGAA